MSEKKDKIGEEAVWMCAENERLKSCLEDQHAATDGLHNALNDIRSQLTEAERKLKEAEEFWKHNFNAILLQAKQVGCIEVDVGLEDGGTSRVLRNELADSLRARVEKLEAALTDVLASAHPNEREHPTMFAAFDQARAALAK